MEARVKLTLSLDSAYKNAVETVGGKARNISLCKRAGYNVPDGFCITTEGYRQFLNSNRLYYLIDKEVTRKSFDDMRWEEIWDSALRIRSAFMKGKMPEELRKELESRLSNWSDSELFSIRSSSIEEDSKTYSYAGIHESFVNVKKKDVLEKVKLVWASLWNDRSLLYKKEKDLDSSRSAMAILIQKMEKRDVSGITFTEDPSRKEKDTMIIEAVIGSLNFLVDNVKMPERVKVCKTSSEILEHSLAGKVEILTEEVAKDIAEKSCHIESFFGEPVDIEWTGIKDRFTVLQVRPITSVGEDPVDERKWYLTLTPRGDSLIELAERVEKVLIPELKKESEVFSGKEPDLIAEEDLIEEIKLRGESYEKWAKVYWDDFIPFAHGIRNFGIFYNDLVNPEDTYEFIYLLKTNDLIAYKRNDDMKKIAENMKSEQKLREHLNELLESGIKGERLLEKIKETNAEISYDLLEFLKENMSVGYEGVSLEERPEIPVGVILRMAEESGAGKVDRVNSEKYVDSYFIKAREAGMFEEASIWLRVGRVSWKLRDDDNILLGKLENQLLIFMKRGLELLRDRGQVNTIPNKLNPKDWEKIHRGLCSGEKIEIDMDGESKDNGVDRAKPRQLLGQPSSPGIYTGKARVIGTVDDFSDVERGEVLVFDSVQPQMTFIISLAGAIVERRGGMLVHSSIIARELHIPSVNGVTKVTKLIKTGDTVTVNGDLGIVTVGSRLFDI